MQDRHSMNTAVSKTSSNHNSGVQMTHATPNSGSVAGPMDKTSTRSTSTAERIVQIVENRKHKRPRIQQELSRWAQIRQSLQQVPGGLRALAAADNSHGAQVQALLKKQSDLFVRVTTAQQNLDVASRRFARTTVNIGVSGRARTGKSTLLRSISGLGEAQIPTGEFIPTTAVRSLIFHQARDPHADIQFHSYESFRDSTLDKYHSELGLNPTPQTLDEFRRYRYPADVRKFAEGRPRIYDAEAMVLRLKDMQGALLSYADLLTGERTKLTLDKLRPYVAYPTQEEKNAGSPSRKYLAVKECKIYTPFARGGVEHLGVVDLPGLGEVDPKAESRMVEGLQNEADIVLFLLRDEDSDLSVGKKEIDAMNVIDDARKPIKTAEDYVFVTLNVSTNDPRRIDALRAEANEKLGRHRILECDAADPSSVADRVLTPVLEHLVERLPSMDSDVWEAAISEAEQLERELGGFAQTVERLARQLLRQSDQRKRLDGLAKSLRKELASRFEDIVQASYKTGTEQDFCNAVDTVDKGVKEFVKNGFHQGDSKAWLKNASASILSEAGWGEVQDTTRNELRIHVSSSFQALEDFFEDCVDRLREDVGEALESSFGAVVQLESGENRLEAFIRACGDDYPTLKDAIRAVSELEVAYNSHLYPWVRENLGELEPRQYDHTARGERRNVVVAGNNIDASTPRKTAEKRAEELYAKFQELAESVSGDISTTLKEHESRTGVRVLSAAAAKFDDEFLRSPDSRDELRDFVEQYADKIYPDEFGKDKAVQDVLEQSLLPISVALKGALAG